MSERRELKFLASQSAGEVSAIFDRPDGARWLLVFGHGAGAGMRHAFMDAMAEKLGAHGIATFRYQFPYMEKRTGRPDFQPILLATVRSAVTAATAAAPDLPLIAGGKSMGGRMTSLAASDGALPGVRGIVFFGFPLHLAGKPNLGRADHLERVMVRMLFLQGTRDKMADLALIEDAIALTGGRGSLHVIEGGDHSFAVLKSTGRTADQVYEDVASAVERWADGLKETR